MATLWSGTELNAQTSTTRTSSAPELNTDPATMYDYYGQGQLLSKGNLKFINANNDTLIDLCSNLRVYLPTSMADYYFNTSSSTEYGIQIQPSISFSNTPFVLDYNNDGMTDFLSYGQNFGTVYSLNYKGEYVAEKLRLMTPEQYAGERLHLNLSTSFSLSSSWSDMYIYPTKYENISTTTLTAIDLNGDDLPDFYSEKRGDMFQSTQEGVLIGSSMGGVTKVRDFNGDGLMDYVYYDNATFANTVNLTNKDGSVTSTKLLERVCSGGRIWCYDFDGDNDVDIMIPVDYIQEYGNGEKKNNGFSIVLIAENKGDGTFKKHEIGFDGHIYFRQCVDYDADGKYELIAYKEVEENGKSVVVAYRINGMDIEDKPEELLPEITNFYTNYGLLIADIHLQGIPSIVYKDPSSYNIGYTYAQIIGAQENTAPQQPDTPTFTYDASEGLLKIKWSPSSDKESTAADLSYALRIGTEENSGNTFYAHARPDGTRRNLLDGNCGFSTQRTLNVSSWAAGDYYIAVQAVDAGHRGSAFSRSVKFHKPEPSTDFIPSYKLHGFGVNDTCRITLRTPKEPGCTYKWNLADAVILSQTDENADMLISFPTGGTKEITLVATGANGMVSKTRKTIEVVPASVTKSNNNFTAKFHCLDVDGNGTTEIFQSKLYEGDANGNYTVVKKLWNASYPPKVSSVYIVDANRDGMPDLHMPRIYDSDTKEKSHCIIINEGDMQMALTVGEGYLHEYTETTLDLDNDGDFDLVIEPQSGDITIGENTSGDYKSWQYSTNGEIGAYLTQLIAIDYNKDGLTDFYNKMGKFDRIIVNNGDFTFTTQPISTKKGVDSQTIIDADGDGKWDKFYGYSGSYAGGSFYGSKIDVVWGDGTEQSIPCPDGSPFSSAPHFYDIDNNGCLDMLVTVNNSTPDGVVYYFNPDHTYTFSLCYLAYESGYFRVGNPKEEYTSSAGVKMAGGNALSCKVNNRPEAPTELRSSQNAKSVVIEWNHSMDQETPAALMRYNISIKHKGKSGVGAYLISPLNMDNDETELPSPIPLLTSNKITIPLQSIPAGEYEVKVQGVDRWHSQSKFSATYLMTVHEQSLIESPSTATINVPIVVKIAGNSETVPDFGENAIAEQAEDGSYSVKWTTVGMKTVKIGTIAQQNIYVQDKPAGDFSVPSEVMQNAFIHVTGHNLLQGTWEVAIDNGEFLPLSESGIATILDGGNNDRLTMTFNRAGHYELRHQVSNEDTSCHYSSTFNVVEGTPSISIVEIDPSSPHYRISWTNNNAQQDDIEQIYIYKETAKYNQYQLLDSVTNTQTHYVDITSEPDTKAARYRIAYKLTYGESAWSKAHQPIHVMINKGVGEAYNLSWSKYEGLTVESYRIIGGTTADNLQEIDLISGHLTTYTTPSTSANRYYAIEPIISATDAKSRSGSYAISTSARSNVVCTDNAMDVTLANEILVMSENGVTKIGRNNINDLQLYAYLYPVNATIKRINWSITQGEDIATITPNGLLTVHGVGNVTACAQTVDGTDVADEIQIVAQNDRDYLGDVNIDEFVTINDVVVMSNYILEKETEVFCFNSGDINADGKISIGDMVATVDIILGGGSVPASNNVSTRTTSQDFLSVASPIENGESTVIPIALENSLAYTAFQMDVTAPEGAALASAELTSRASNSHSIVWRQLANGKIRIVAYSPNNTEFSGNTGELLTLHFTTTGATNATQSQMNVDNIIFVTSNGNTGYIDGTTAIVDVEAEGMNIYAEDGCIFVESNKKTELPLYNIQGILIKTLSVEIGKNTYNSLPSGVYLLNGNKLYVK